MKTKNQLMKDIHLSELEIDSDSVEYENDEDICSESELEKKFCIPYHLAYEKAISLNKDYILDITGDTNSNKIGSALSNKSCFIHTITESSIIEVNHLSETHSKRISNIRFNPTNCQLFYSGSLDGTINVWDLRQQDSAAIHTFKDDTNGQPKPITCFDISENGNLLCAGTELVGGDAFLLFWDLRKAQLLGGYWQSHTDDITKVRFHKTKDLLASSSTDGLINVYDISETSEHEALIHTLNTESSVDKIDWFIHRGPGGHESDAIHCITHTECVGLWNIEDGDFYRKYSRDDVSQAMLKKSKEDVYIANIHDDDDQNQLFIVAGSNQGRGECLRTLQINKDDGSISPRSLFVGNKQIVRSSWFDSKNKMLISGGECSILSVWRPRPTTITEPGQQSSQINDYNERSNSTSSDSKLLKNTSKLKNYNKNKRKPY